MSASYLISVDSYRKLVSLKLTGFFTFADAGELIVDVRAAVVSVGCAPNSHLTLCDVSACKLQPQDVVSAFGDHMRDQRYQSRRFAFVVGNSAARMQVRRLLDRGNVACFDDPVEAECWLVSGGAAAA